MRYKKKTPCVLSTIQVINYFEEETVTLKTVLYITKFEEPVFLVVYKKMHTQIFFLHNFLAKAVYHIIKMLNKNRFLFKIISKKSLKGIKMLL